jgi:hypothetical protein
MSLSSAEGQGRRHKTCTGQFFTKSRGLLNIKIDATLHLIGPNTDFVATFDHTDTEQITIAIHKIRKNMTGSFDASGLLQQLEEMLNYYFAQFCHMEKVLYKIRHTTSLYNSWVHNHIKISNIQQRRLPSSILH